jgi:putative transposase
VIVAYIDAYKHQFGVEPICRVLTGPRCADRPEHLLRLQEPLTLRQEPLGRAPAAHREGGARDNYSVYGVRKMWHALRAGRDIGRDQVARLMRAAGLRGVSRRKRVRRASSEAPPAALPDLVRRDWFRDAPDLVWVCDFTHVLTREGWMYVSFLQDAFSRRILGFAVRSSKGVELVTRTLLQAVNERQRSSATVHRRRRHCA